MRAIAIGAIIFAVIVVIVTKVNQPDDPMRAGDYVREYGGNHGTYAGILRETDCARLPETWDVGLAMESRQGTGIADAALHRYEELGC